MPTITQYGKGTLLPWKWYLLRTEQPKKAFQNDKWVARLNSLAAEKNAEIVNHVSYVLSNLALASKYILNMAGKADSSSKWSRRVR